MGREQRKRRADQIRSLTGDDRRAFQHQYSILFSVIAFAVSFFVSLTTGIYAMSRVERAALWALIAFEVVRLLRL